MRYTISILQSHPLWDAWVEIPHSRLITSAISCRIPYGMRELKYSAREYGRCVWRCRIPYGMRELKYRSPRRSPSHPLWDAWVEIPWRGSNTQACCVASLMGCVSWNEEVETAEKQFTSHPLWDAWVEMKTQAAGGLSQNQSHPFWDAWVEIRDRTSSGRTAVSHPLWDAWVEIKRKIKTIEHIQVASLMGCVSWNTASLALSASSKRRIPYGMRELKPANFSSHCVRSSHPLWGAWVEIRTTTQPSDAHPSHPWWAAWVEMPCARRRYRSSVVAPLAGAWVEIIYATL